MFLSRIKQLQSFCFVLYLVSLFTSISEMELFSALLVLLLGIEFTLKRPAFRDWVFPPLFKPLLCFIGVIWLGILLGDASFRDKLYDFQRVRFFFLYFFLYYVLREQIENKIGSRVLVGMCVAIGVYGTLQHFVSIDLVRPEGKKVLLYAIQNEKIGPLVVGTFNHHLTFSNVFLFYATLFFGIGLSHFPKKSGILLLGGWIYLLCLWTESRMGWVAIPITVSIIALIRGWKFFLTGLVGISLLFVTLYQFDPGFQERLKRTVGGSEDAYSVGPRSRLWKAQLEMFKDHLWLGVGFNNNERKAREYVNRLYPERDDNFYGHAHSNVLQLLSTTGLLGLACYFWLWCTIFITNVRYLRLSTGALERGLAIGLLAGFIGFHLQGITQWNFGDAEVLHNLIFFWALLFVITSEKNGSKKIIAI